MCPSTFIRFIKEIIEQKREICILITIWSQISTLGVYCYLDVGYDTMM